jgi:hypothetical protein
MTINTTVGICSVCGGPVIVTDPHFAKCPCGQTTFSLGAPGELAEKPKRSLRLVKDDE